MVACFFFFSTTTSAALAEVQQLDKSRDVEMMALSHVSFLYAQLQAHRGRTSLNPTARPPLQPMTEPSWSEFPPHTFYFVTFGERFCFHCNNQCQNEEGNSRLTPFAAGG